MSRVSMRALLPVVLSVLALSVTVPGAGARSVPRARAAGGCHISQSRSYGYTYLTWLWVYKTNCGVGQFIARHHGHWKGWTCTQKRIGPYSPIQYQAKKTCHSGRREVAWTFSQNK